MAGLPTVVYAGGAALVSPPWLFDKLLLRAATKALGGSADFTSVSVYLNEGPTAYNSS